MTTTDRPDARPRPTCSGAAPPARPATRSTRPARTPRSTCCGCSTTGSCGSPRPPSTTPTGTGSCSPRATGRPPTTRCSPPRASSRVDWLDDTGRAGQPARPPPGPAPGPGRGDRLRLPRPRPRAGASAPRSACAPRACTTPTGVRPARRRRTRRGLQPRGDRVRRRDRAGQPHRDRGRQRVGHATAGRAASPPGSPSTAGPPPPWTAATTTQPSDDGHRSHRGGRTARTQRPRHRGRIQAVDRQPEGGGRDMRERVPCDDAAALLDRRSPDRHRAGRHLRRRLHRGGPAASGPGHQRGHPGTADGRRRGRARPHRAAPDRALATPRSSSSGRTSRSSWISTTRASARCWSASARPTTGGRRAAPT